MMNSERDLRTAIADGLHRLGLLFSSVELDRLVTWLAELDRWNHAINLTGIQPVERVDKIVLESAALVAMRQSLPGSNSTGIWADLGTGAGIPGMVIGILCPDQPVWLIDSISRKTDFLHHICRELALRNITVITNRIEKFGREPELQAVRFQSVFARAFGSVAQIVRMALPVMSETGILILPRGTNAVAEWQAFRPEWQCHGDGGVVELAIPFRKEPVLCLVLQRMERIPG